MTCELIYSNHSQHYAFQLHLHALLEAQTKSRPAAKKQRATLSCRQSAQKAVTNHGQPIAQHVHNIYTSECCHTRHCQSLYSMLLKWCLIAKLQFQFHLVPPVQTLHLAAGIMQFHNETLQRHHGTWRASRGISAAALHEQ